MASPPPTGLDGHDRAIIDEFKGSSSSGSSSPPITAKGGDSSHSGSQTVVQKCDREVKNVPAWMAAIKKQEARAQPWKQHIGSGIAEDPQFGEGNDWLCMYDPSQKVCSAPGSVAA